MWVLISSSQREAIRTGNRLWLCSTAFGWSVALPFTADLSNHSIPRPIDLLPMLAISHQVEIISELDRLGDFLQDVNAKPLAAFLHVIWLFVRFVSAESQPQEIKEENFTRYPPCFPRYTVSSLSHNYLVKSSACNISAEGQSEPGWVSVAGLGIGQWQHGSSWESPAGSAKAVSGRASKEYPASSTCSAGKGKPEGERSCGCLLRHDAFLAGDCVPHTGAT